MSACNDFSRSGCSDMIGNLNFKKLLTYKKALLKKMLRHVKLTFPTATKGRGNQIYHKIVACSKASTIFVRWFESFNNFLSDGKHVLKHFFFLNLRYQCRRFFLFLTCVKTTFGFSC